VFLAFGNRAIPNELARYTNRTMVERSTLESNLGEARRNGFSSDDEEYSPGVRCVATPLRRDDGTLVAAIGLSGPSARIDLRRLSDLGRLLRDRSRKLVPVKGKAA
jgi:DNA-binding IclR family transcriptional regulator